MVFTVGLIGLGRIGMGFELDSMRSKPASHLGALKALRKQLTLQYVCDIDPTLQREAEEVYGSPLKFIYQPIDVLDEKVDVAVVATPPETHFNIVRLLAENGVRRPRLIFVEKPLTESSRSAFKLLSICLDNNVEVAVNHSRRWDPLWQQVKQIVDGKKFGELTNFTGLYSGSPLNVGVHMADLAIWFNAPRHIGVDVENNSCVIFDVKLVFERGMLDIVGNGIRMIEYIPCDSRRFTGVKEYSEGTDIWSRKPSKGETPMKFAYSNILNHLEREEPIACGGEDGMLAVRTVEGWMQHV